MHCADLGERVITVQRKVVARADVPLKQRRPGERLAEYPARIRNFRSAVAMQRAEVDRCSVSPQECRLLDQLAAIPGASGLDAEPGRDAGHDGGLNAAD